MEDLIHPIELRTIIWFVQNVLAFIKYREMGMDGLS